MDSPENSLSSEKVRVGARARLRKPHPCGGRDWNITRTGAEIHLECLTCGRKLILTREEFERRCQSISLPDNLPANE